MDIRQDFIISATSAFNTLGSLQNAFQRFEERLRGTGKAIKEFNDLTSSNRSGVSGLARSVGTLTRNLRNLNAASPGRKLADGFDAAEGQLDELSRSVRRLNSNMDRTRGNTRRLTLSFERLTRVVTTQLIVRTMSQIRDAVREALGAAIDLEKQFALITTIQPGSNLNEIGDAVRSISDNLNINQLEVARGLYDAISNQVSELFTETVRFTEAAGRFARATGSTLSDSVDLLSGAIRSYGLTVDDVDRVQGIFFSAIDKGRVTADELANTFGRVGPAARAIGISLEEVAGSVAAISDRGLGTAETLTAVRGIITALTKPTDDLKAVLQDLGFATGESAISTLGFVGTLRALTDSTGGSVQGLSRLFPRIRGLTGILAGASDNFETLEANINAATEAGESFGDSKFLQATATNAEVVTKAIQQVRNQFIELGKDATDAAATAIKALQELAERSDAAALAVEQLTSVGSALGLGIAGAVALALAGFGPLTIAVAAVGTAVIAATQLWRTFRNVADEEITAVINRQEELAESTLQTLRDSNQEQIDDIKERNEEIVRAGSLLVRETSRQLNDTLALNKAFNDARVADAEDTVDAIIKSEENALKAIVDTIEKADERIRESTNKTRELRDQLDARRFERTIRDATPAQAIFALTDRAADRAREAERLIQRGTRTGNEALVQRGEQLFEQAQRLTDRAEGIAGDDAGLRAQAERAGDQILQRNIRAQEQRTRELERAGSAAERELTAAQELLVRQRSIADVIKSRLELEGTTAEKVEQQVAAIRELVGLLQEAGTVGDVLNNAGLTELGSRFADRFREQTSTLGDELVGDLATSIERALETQQVVREALPIEQALSQGTGRDVAAQIVDEASFDPANRALRELAQRQETLTQKQNEITESSALFANELGNAVRALDAIEGENLPERLREARDVLRDIASDGQVTREELSGAVERINELAPSAREALIPFGEFGLFQDRDTRVGLELLERAAQSLSDAANVDIDIFTEEDQSRLRDSTTGLLDVAQQSGEQIALGGNEAAQSLIKAALAARQVLEATNPRVQTPGNVNPTAPQQFGGFFQSGGVATRGVDTQLAAVSPGERIIDRRNSQRFFPQLAAIGAGRAPVIRSEGDVTTVGDVSVTVQGGQSSPATARVIGEELRRLIKRGQLKL